MKTASDMKALFIVVNAGFTDEVMEVARAEGASGATIINARGEGLTHKLFLGITVDSEKEMILTIVEKDIAHRIMSAVKKQVGLKSPAHGICFIIPVEKMVGINRTIPQVNKD